MSAMPFASTPAEDSKRAVSLSYGDSIEKQPVSHTAGVLELERAKASFSSADLIPFMVGQRPQNISKFKHLFESEPFEDHTADYFKSYEELFVAGLKRVGKGMEILRSNPKLLVTHMAQKVAMADFFDSAHLAGIHFSMFLTYIKTQANDEQQKAWMPGATAGKYMGAYAQTELGHGSNVRGLETTATYDKATCEFEIHSPTITSTKWWPTGMYASTHGVVFARLIDGEGRDQGFHGFFMQFRDERGFLLPGVEIGEIGPKVNGLHANIGYARFNRVRVPRFNLFARYSQVTPEGKYIKAPRKLSKFKYISMMNIRVGIVGHSYRGLAQAATIAVRYSCVRVQGFKDTQSSDAISTGENCVMDYKMQQYRLFKAVALAYGFFWNARYIADYLKRVQDEIVAGNDAAADELPELHATCAGLKVWTSVWAHANIEDCRKACGGQGFLLSSGVSEQSRSFAEQVTVEGEQVILSLQVARFLIKAVDAVDRGESVAGTVTYLLDPALADIGARLSTGADAGSNAVDPNLLLDMLKDRASRTAREVHGLFQAAIKRGLPFDKALNSVAITAYKSAECHSAFVIARNNYTALQEYVKDPSTFAVLSKLFELMCLQIVRENAGDWIDVLDSGKVAALLARTDTLLDLIRPDAVALVDSFGFLDSQLKSAIGRHDGHVYEAILREAKRSPLNQSPRMLGWEHLAPGLDLDFLKEGAKKQRQAAGARL